MANKTVVEYTPSQRDAVCDYLHEQFGESENGFITHGELYYQVQQIKKMKSSYESHVE